MDNSVTSKDVLVLFARITLSFVAAYILTLCVESIVLHPVPFWSIYVGMMVTYLVLKKWE